MGMFDYIYYNDIQYQSKDTPDQALHEYKIEIDQNDGHAYLWLEEYDAHWVETTDHFLGGYLYQDNERWVLCDDFTGSINFYRSMNKEYSEWEEYTASFVNGQMANITLEYTTQ